MYEEQALILAITEYLKDDSGKLETVLTILAKAGLTMPVPSGEFQAM